MEQLPDDVLLAVLRYLDVRALLTCRLVCKRLEGLVLHPHAWRHRVLDLGVVCRKSALSVLCLAPCLNELRVPLLELRLHPVLCTTRCAVSSLRVHFGNRTLLSCDNCYDPITSAALIIRNQEALGRLRQLHVSGLHHYACLSNNSSSVLFRTILMTSGLTTLEIYEFPVTTMSSSLSMSMLMPHPRCLPSSSLRFFDCELWQRSESFCNAVLVAHGDTLEVVNLGDAGVNSTSWAALLAGMPNLRRLSSCMAPGLEAAAACESLEEVELYVKLVPEYDDRAATEFLRRATQLRKVTLVLEASTGVESLPVLNTILSSLVQALAHSGQSRVESLAIRGAGSGCRSRGDNLAVMRSVLMALHFLPELRDLKLGVVSDEIFQGIRPETAPALRTLNVVPDAICAHDCLHKDSVQQLLCLYPTLKLYVWLPKYCLKNYLCNACAMGCHQELLTAYGGSHDNMSVSMWRRMSHWVLIS